MPFCSQTDHQTLQEEVNRKDVALLSFEAEIDSLNYKVKSLSKDIADRKVLDESGENLPDVIKRLLEEKLAVEEKFQRVSKDLGHSASTIRQLELTLRTAGQELSVSKENLTVANVTLARHDLRIEVEDTMLKLQEIWEELGVDTIFREECRRRIEYCLEDTCKRELDGTLTLKRETEVEIQALAKKVDGMRKALGSSVANYESQRDDSRTLQETLALLRRTAQELGIPYRFASARRERILKDAKELATALGLCLSELPADLKVLMKSKDHWSGSEDTNWNMPDSMTHSNDEDSVALPFNCLQTDFLTSCEGHVMQLRVKKSENLVRIRELQQLVTDLVGHMHLNGRQALELVEESMQRNVFRTPTWWDPTLAGNLLLDIAQMKFFSSSSTKMSDHMEWVHTVLSSAAHSRRTISDALKLEIERAQRTLLDIVGREIDASDAYAGFHDALFRLPSSSKDLIVACVSEMEALVDGIEAMTQSEIEALTVVWEALKILPADRRNFWGMVEKAESQGSIILFKAASPFCEEWMETSIQKATAVYGNMDKRLQKLKTIHKEVEKLRSKQDTKSQILSLDSEIRIMNAKLLDFEEFQCDKKRLLTKKNGGATLLKEERFRKQMQGKFSSNLGQLASLLRSWEVQEGATFDASLLSDDVRMLLDEPGKMENWVERRTQFMALRTVKSQTPMKRPNESSNSAPSRVDKRGARQSTGLTPPRKKAAAARKVFRNRSSDDTSTTSSESTVSKLKMVQALRRNEGNALQEPALNDQQRMDLDDVTSAKRVTSPKRPKKKQKNSGSPLPPFGRILSDLSPPTSFADAKENSWSNNM